MQVAVAMAVAVASTYADLQTRTSSVPPLRASEELTVESIRDEIF